jgi:hypothetical protein
MRLTSYRTALSRLYNHTQRRLPVPASRTMVLIPGGVPGIPARTPPFLVFLALSLWLLLYLLITFGDVYFAFSQVLSIMYHLQ